MAECRAAQAAERKDAQGRLVRAADEHSAWETPFRMAFGVVLSLGVAALASSVSDLLRALRVILERLLAIAGDRVTDVVSLLRRRRPAQAHVHVDSGQVGASRGRRDGHAGRKSGIEGGAL
jgi:hypothetical protein